MKFGVYEWSFLLDEKFDDNYMLGIASNTAQRQHATWLGSAEGDFGFDHNWNLFSGETKSVTNATAQQRLSLLGNSSELTFKLSLYGGNSDRLQVSVDGGQFVTLFSGNLLEQCNGSGFLPAASVWGSKTVQFDGYERVGGMALKASK